MQRKANILLCFTLDPELPHQWKATTPCRQEDGWRTCYLAYDVYKDDFIKRCLTEKNEETCLKTYNNKVLRDFPHYYNMANELPLHTKICVPRNHDLKFYCNLTQYEDNNQCSTDELAAVVPTYRWSEWKYLM